MSYKTRAILLRQLQGERGGEVATNFPQNVTGCTENTGCEAEPCPGPGSEGAGGTGLGPAVLKASLPSEGRPGPVCLPRSLRTGYPRSEVAPNPTTAITATTTTTKKIQTQKRRDEGPAQPKDSGISPEVGRLCLAVAPTSPSAPPRPSKSGVCKDLRCSRTAGAIRNGSGPFPKPAPRLSVPSARLPFSSARSPPPVPERLPRRLSPRASPDPVTSQNARDFGQI